MKEGLSGSIVNEIEVNERWTEMQAQARKSLTRLKELEAIKPKPYLKNGIGYHTEGFKELAGKIMEKRSKERYKRSNEH